MSKRTDFSSKPMKRSHTRKLPQDCIINMAETRKQIAQALQLHRLSSSSTTMSIAGHGCCGYEKPVFSVSGQRMLDNLHIAAPHYFCYSILESMPLPQPIWSTTAPAVIGSPAVVATEETESFEWGDGQTSYNWWLGFLRTLDVHSKEKYPNAENSTTVGMSTVTMRQEGFENGETVFLETSDQSSCTDEWLIIPISEDGNGIGNDLESN